MAIPSKNVLGNPNVTEGSFQIAIEQLRESVIGSGKVYDSANTYMIKDICEYSGVTYYSKINNNIGNTPSIGANWGDYADLINGAVHKTGNETIAGVKIFSSSPLLPVPTLANQAISMGNILEKTGAGIGYGTGSGGTVTQLTSKGTSVTLNKPSGRIITHNSTLVSQQSVLLPLYNSFIYNTDNLYINVTDNADYDVKTAWISNGAAWVRITNISGGTLSDSINIGFVIIKGAIA